MAKASHASTINVAGIRIRMGHATLAIMVLPMRIKLSGGKSLILLVSVNHVPQNTPVTSITRIRLTEYKTGLFMSKTLMVAVRE